MTGTTVAPDIIALEDAFAAAERDARALVSGLTAELGMWRAEAGSWSVAECLDHLATSNRVYLAAMQPAAERALARGRTRRGPALPGLVGSWFVRTFEPPVKARYRLPAPRKIRPRRGPSLDDAAGEFLASQDELRAFLRRYGDIDLAGVRFPNPFIRGVRFSLATVCTCLPHTSVVTSGKPGACVRPRNVRSLGHARPPRTGRPGADVGRRLVAPDRRLRMSAAGHLKCVVGLVPHGC
jgi:DinB superfamily